MAALAHDAANLNCAPEDVGAPANCVVDGFKVPKGVTHWRVFRREKDGETRLTYGRHPNGVMPVEWTIDTFSLAEVGKRWGAGVYRIQWYRRDPENGKPLNKGRTEFFQVGAAAPGEADESLPVSKLPPNAGQGGRFCDACGGALAPAARFCSHCGGAAGGVQLPPPAPATAYGPAGELLQALQAAYSAGTATALGLFQSISEQVRATEEARTRRYEADMQARVEEQRQAHQRNLAEQQAWFDRQQQSGMKPGDIRSAVRSVVKEEVQPLHDRLDDLEDDDDDEPEPAPVATEGSLAEKMNAVKTVVETAGPVVSGIADKVLEHMAKRGASAAASGGGG